MDVVLQTGYGMVPRQIHLARRHQKMAVDEVHQAVRQVGREVRAVVRGAILAQAPRYVNARIFFFGELDVRIRLIVAQQNVEARLVLFDEVVFKRKRFLFVVDLNEIDVPGFADQGSGFDVGEAVVIEIAADAGTQIFRLADVDDGRVGVLVKVHSGQQRKFCGLFAEVGGGVDIFSFAPVSCREDELRTRSLTVAPQTDVLAVSTEARPSGSALV